MRYAEPYGRTSRHGDGNRSIPGPATVVARPSQEIHKAATGPLYLVWFVLDTTGFPLHNPAYLLLRSHGEERCGHWGKHDAILAGLDRAVHQSRMFRARTLVAGVSFRSQRWAGILPQLRKFAASSTPADRAAPSHEAAFADCSPPAAQAAIDFSVGVAPS